MPPIKLLQVLGAKGGGGAESFFARLSCALHQSPKVDQHLLVHPNVHRDAQYAAQGLPVTHAPFGAPFLDVVTHWRMRRLLHACRPQVVLSWMNRATAFCPDGKHKGFVHAARLGGYYNLKYYRSCDYLIGNTPRIVDYLVQEGWPKDRATCIPNFVPEPPRHPLSKESLNVPQGVPIILGVGRLHENKAFDVLINGMAQTKEAHLLLVGAGPLEHRLKAQVQEMGLGNRVSFLGWREDVPQLLAACDIFVCPSKHEPLGNVVLEAWAASKPVIAAQSHGPDMLITQGLDGLKFPIGDSSALGHCLQVLLDDTNLQKCLGAAGRQTFLKNYAQEIVVAQYLEFFHRISA